MRPYCYLSCKAKFKTKLLAWKPGHFTLCHTASREVAQSVPTEAGNYVSAISSTEWKENLPEVPQPGKGSGFRFSPAHSQGCVLSTVKHCCCVALEVSFASPVSLATIP